MKKIFIVIFSLVLFACENNNNPDCVKTFDKVQVFGVANNPPNGIVAVAKVCTSKDTDNCTGEIVLIPNGMLPLVEAGEKITLPRHYCFVFIGDYNDVDENNVARKTPVIDFAYDKKVLSENDWKDVIDDMAEQEYKYCLKYATKEFKKQKNTDNEKICKCAVDYIFSNKGIDSENKDRFVIDLRTTLKNKCGKNIPSYTIRDIPEK